LVARGLPAATEAVREEAKGPPVGAPDKAVDGFCRKNNVSRDDLEVREIKGRETWFAVIERPGQQVGDLLAAAIPTIIGDFSWPKSMRWGEASITSESLRWVRPLSGIVALLDGEVVPCIIHGIASGRETYGHRFHSDGPIAIDGVEDYAAKLRDASVIVDHEERAERIRTGAREAAQAAGFALVEDEGLVIENAGLTEWPVPLLGRFDEAFLDVPPEVIQLTARVNQKYFVCEAANDTQAQRLANAFVCTANIAAANPEVVVDGNRKVLAARLSDARFFWELDQKKTLAEHAEGLERITFHEKLGTVADKVERVAKLARWLCEEGTVDGDPDMAEQAARLCKADLVTEMVGEFPELQGVMGGYYAQKEGLPQEVADAIRDHYKPVGQSDEVPTAPVTVAVSLADKLDTLVGFFQIDEKPTGSKDPFALRRATIGILATMLENELRVGLRQLITAAVNPDYSADAGRDIADFFIERLKVQQRESGIRHDMVDAVLANEHDGDTVRTVARVHALQSFVETEDGENLLAGYKRAANILKKEDWGTAGSDAAQDVESATEEVAQTGEEDPMALAGKPEFDAAFGNNKNLDGKSVSYSPEPAEKALIEALDAAGPKAADAVQEERFEDAMAALASLRGPIDAFFEEVTVNDENPDKRAARLDLLARFRDAVHRVADFSRIEG
ncbi:MAG: glycine--tRNA ligase subunit beta, partial [Erythrobacter sp.]